jgi:hypothetical protein
VRGFVAMLLPLSCGVMRDEIKLVFEAYAAWPT